MASQPAQPVEVFISYSHRDDQLRAQLETHLAMLKRKGVVREWSDRRIVAGQEWDKQIDGHLESADIILLLVSPDFLASDYCYDIEVKRAMQRHEADEARVVPVILRCCDDWQSAPFGKLQALPKDARPVTDWPDRDKAFTDVAAGIRTAAEQLRSSRATQPESLGERPKASPSVLIPKPPLIGFVARRDTQGRDIVERLREELAPGRNQPVTLSGPGGIGKTTLAAEAARGLQETYKDRIVWSSADGRADFTLLSLLDDISTQLGRAELRTLAPDKKEEQVRALVAEAPALVVLDNYETVTDGEKERIEAWFKSARCSALFTSRPRVAGTVFVPVSAMSPDEAEEFLEKLAGQTQDPQTFTAEVRRRVYETAEANPHVMQWVVGQIDEAREPDTVFKELAEGEGDAAERVFARSFNLPQLGEDGRAALLALSLFVPSASREALAAVAGFGDERKRLDEAVKNLHALWLIKGIDQNRRLAVEGLTRRLAGARLSKDERAEEFRRRYVAHSLGYAEAHAQQKPEDYDLLEAEKDNLLSATETAFAHEDWWSVMRMAYALARPVDGMLYVRGYWDEALRVGDLALKAARSSQNEEAIAVMAHNVAVMYENRGELDAARWLYGESLEIEKKLGNQMGIARTTSQLGIVHYFLGEIAESKAKHEESLKIRRKIGDQRGIAIDLHQLAILAQNQGELDEAQRLYGESLEIKKRLGNQYGVAVTLHQLGNIAYLQGGLGEARRLYNEGLEINKRLGNQSGIAITLYQLGRLAEDTGDKAEAARLFREALTIFEKLHSPYADLARRSLKRVEGESS